MKDLKIMLSIMTVICLIIESINGYAQINNTPGNIDIIIPADIQRIIEQGMDYSYSATDRISSICYLGKMGVRAVDAIPSLLMIMIRDPNDGELDYSMYCWQDGPLRSWTLAYDDAMYTTPGDEAARALVSIGRPAVEPLIKFLKNAPESAAWALGEIGDSRAVEPLINIMRENPSEATAWALGKFRDRRAVLPLVNYFQKFGSETAAWALIQLEDTLSIEPMIAALKSERSKVRINAARFLGEISISWEIKNYKAVEPLMAIINDPIYQVRENAVIALGQIGDSRSVNPLLFALNDSVPSVREYTAWALGEVGNNKAAKTLIMALKDADSNVRANAAGALGKIGDVRAINHLIALMNDEDVMVQQNATIALGKIGDHRAVDSLINLVDHQNWRIKNSAQWALTTITGCDFSNNLETWRKWWKQNKRKFIKNK